MCVCLYLFIYLSTTESNYLLSSQRICQSESQSYDRADYRDYPSLSTKSLRHSPIASHSLSVCLSLPPPSLSLSLSLSVSVSLSQPHPLYLSFYTKPIPIPVFVEFPWFLSRPFFFLLPFFTAVFHSSPFCWVLNQFD